MEEEVNSTDVRATRRQVQPNVTLDQEGVRNESLLRLRRSRRSAKGNITKKIDQITLSMSLLLSVEEMSSIAHEFKNTVDAFRSAHANYHALLSDEEDILDSQDYYESECKRIDDFQLTIEQWIAKASSGPCENAVSVVHPEDSVSNVGSRSRARSRASLASLRKSTGGSSARYVQSPRLVAAAKRAALSAEAASLHKQQALQEEELRLKQEETKRQQLHEEARLRLDQRKRELDLETKIAKVEAEERTYAIAELEAPSVRQSSRTHSHVPSLSWGREPHPVNQPRPPKEPYVLQQAFQPEQSYPLQLPQSVDLKPATNTAYVPVSSAFKSEEQERENKSVMRGPQDSQNPLPSKPVGDVRLNNAGDSSSSADSSTGERFLQELIDIQREQQRHNEQLVFYQQSRDRQLQELLSQQHRLSLTLSLPSTEVQVFDGDPVNYCNFVRSFENLIEAKTTDSNARLYYLVQYTRGDAQDLMKGCLSMKPDEGYVEARRLLKERYGQGYKIATALVDRVINGPPVKHEDSNALQKFSVLLTSCKNTLKEIGYLNKIENPDSLQKVVRRLPFPLRQKWRDVADGITNNIQREITFDDLAKFVEAKARVLAHPVFGNVSGDAKTNSKDSKGLKNRKGTSFATWVGAGSQEGDASLSANASTNTAGAMRVPPKCPLCKNKHVLARCRDFKRLSVDQRFQFVRKNRLCDNCLLPGHFVKVCFESSFCKIPGCKFKHSTYLHADGDIRQADQPSSNGNASGDGPAISDGNGSSDVQNSHIGVDSQCALIGAGHSATALPIVPVKVKARDSNRTVSTYAFLDSGSNTTFCTHELMRILDIEGEKTRLSLTTLGKHNCITECVLFSLEVFDLAENNLVELPTVFSVPVLPVSKDSIPRQDDLLRFPYLRGIQIPSIDSEIGLLIGSDVPKALEPQEVRVSQGQGPFATRTVFGWTVNGPLGRMGGAQPSANFMRADQELTQQFRMFCNWEFCDSIYDDRPAMSREDTRALTTMKESICLKKGHYEIALPWREDVPCLPNNRTLAEHRLKLLHRRLLRNPELHSKYSSFMDSLFENGHARRVPENRLKHPVGPVWYLPHHPVMNPNKPNKVRVVFDCAARYDGVSLNSTLLQGPDLANNLIGVLTRFRQEPVAVMADIEGMFHQVYVNPKDCDALRFLWWPGNDLNSDPAEHQMLVHLFGATSSPSCANFGLRRTADDNQDVFSKEVIDTVRRNFYVDDCLKSVRNEVEAIPLVSDLRELLSKGGFRLTKWISNSRRVIESLPISERAVSVKDHLLDQLPIERALGVRWDVESDTFGFKITLKDRPSTRRGILSVVSSVYDPLGFAAPFILPAKRILQDLCRKGLGWDTLVSDDDLAVWQNWLKDLPRLESLKVERCFKPADFGEVASCQIHHFADASQFAYGAVSYLRITNTRGDIYCSFLIGKSRLSPLKQLTIPRLELCAAVVATRLEKMVRREIDMQVNQSVFWTDSACVLGYISNESKRFHTFVANRVAAIQEVASSSQWRHVGTLQNPADDASRGLSAMALMDSSRWLRGPDFLWQPELAWPMRSPTVREVSSGDPEVRRTAEVLSLLAGIQESPMNKIFERFSSWYRLTKFIAWALRYRAKLRVAVKQRRAGHAVKTVERNIVPISLDELKTAEREIIKQVQRECFQDEFAALVGIDSVNPAVTNGEHKGKRRIKKSSKIIKLDPRVMDGLLRVGGRLANGSFQPDVKHPMILPKSHHVVTLIIRHYHHFSGHSGVEHVLSMLREKFWVVSARAAVRKSLGVCVDCKRRQARVGEQKMADLPQDRITPDKPPFTYVGVDCFGPFLIRRGRSEVKRYGVLYTCLVVRAVHIEVSQSLDTDSFLNSFRRFVARRGAPEQMRSDNGGNFVSGESELRHAINNWNQEKIVDFLLQRNVQWIFNPPAGSHYGGAWERCIRTVRKVLNALVREQVLDDEGLATLMCEVESIVNSRPLTKVSDDARDLQPLTPNHLLLLRPGPSLPPGTFTREDLYSRRRWRQVQYLSDVFWRRWMKEYLPGLQERQRWSRPMRNFQVGDVVLLADEKTPRGLWPLARILDVKRNKKDGLVRSVTLKTKSSVLQRPIDKIVLLEAAAEVPEETKRPAKACID